MTALGVQAAIASAGVRPRVLVVEDEVLVRLVVAEALREAGCQVIEAASTDEAVEALRAAATLDVLVTDVQLQGPMDGLELAARVRRTAPGAKVIVTSGHAPVETAERVADAFLAKPFDLWRLVGQVRTLAANA